MNSSMIPNMLNNNIYNKFCAYQSTAIYRGWCGRRVWDADN